MGDHCDAAVPASDSGPLREMELPRSRTPVPLVVAPSQSLGALFGVRSAARHRLFPRLHSAAPRALELGGWNSEGGRVEGWKGGTWKGANCGTMARGDCQTGEVRFTGHAAFGAVVAGKAPRFQAPAVSRPGQDLDLIIEWHGNGSMEADTVREQGAAAPVSNHSYT